MVTTEMNFKRYVELTNDLLDVGTEDLGLVPAVVLVKDLLGHLLLLGKTRLLRAKAIDVTEEF